MGEQYNVVAEEFQSVFNLSLYASMIFLVALLIIGIICFKREKKVMAKIDAEKLW